MRGVFDIAAQDLQTVDFTRQRGGDGGVLDVIEPGHDFRGTGSVVFHHRGSPQLGDEVADLAQRHRVGVDALDAGERGALWCQQAVLDAQKPLADDGEAAFGQQRMHVRSPGDGVFRRQHGEAGRTLMHRGDGGAKGLAGQGLHAGKGHVAGEVGIGAGLALEGDDCHGAAPSSWRAWSRSA